ncbi:MAG: type VI secretion system protein TssA, partial [Gemmatimonadota bacterium]|nr:type VI secretion system protein TssA [Gemmatimonadota bacterium]
MTLSAELLSPIAGNSPTGVDLRYDPAYERIREARREDTVIATSDDDPWKTKNPKVADWPLTIRLASEALASRSKDLQVAVWLTEALLRQEGFSAFGDGLNLLIGLLDNFWEGLFPELEDGDAELRVAPLSWLALKLDLAVRSASIMPGGYCYLDYLEASQLPGEAEAKEDWGGEKQQLRERALAEGKILPEQIEAATARASKEWYRSLLASVSGCLDSVRTLAERCDQ